MWCLLQQRFGNDDPEEISTNRSHRRAAIQFFVYLTCISSTTRNVHREALLPPKRQVLHHDDTFSAADHSVSVQFSSSFFHRKPRCLFRVCEMTDSDVCVPLSVCFLLSRMILKGIQCCAYDFGVIHWSMQFKRNTTPSKAQRNFCEWAK